MLEPHCTLESTEKLKNNTRRRNQDQYPGSLPVDQMCGSGVVSESSPGEANAQPQLRTTS